MGISDVISSLQWIQSYIHHFGGDPNNVTCMGQSAGQYGCQYMYMYLGQLAYHQL